MQIGMAAPLPITGIVAYSADRSLEAIAAQTRKLDAELTEPSHRPDFIAVIGQGIVGPRGPIRGQFNAYATSGDAYALTDLRKTGRHTLLRLYLQMLRELNTIILCPLDLSKYEDMPKIVGPYRVRNHDRLFRPHDTADAREKVYQLSEGAIREIRMNSKTVTVRENFLHYIGVIPAGYSDEKLNETNP